MDSNSPAYEILLINELTYRFTTQDGGVYECSFISFADYFSAYPDIAANVYSFNLYPVSDEPKHKGADPRLASTVIKIVASFLSSMVEAVVYVCDPSDGRDAVRFRKFKRWYSQTHSSTKIVQVTKEVDAGGMTLFTALLVHEDNPLKERFLQAYYEVLGKEL